MMAEMMPESLVLLKRLLCADFEDIVVLGLDKKNYFGSVSIIILQFIFSIKKLTFVRLTVRAKFNI